MSPGPELCNLDGFRVTRSAIHIFSPELSPPSFDRTVSSGHIDVLTCLSPGYRSQRRFQTMYIGCISNSSTTGRYINSIMPRLPPVPITIHLPFTINAIRRRNRSRSRQATYNSACTLPGHDSHHRIVGNEHPRLQPPNHPPLVLLPFRLRSTVITIDHGSDHPHS